MRPQVAPLGEPSRIVARVREGRLEQRRRGCLLEAPKGPRSRGWRIPRDRASSEYRGGAGALPHRLAVSTGVIPANASSIRLRTCMKTRGSSTCAAAAGFGSCLRARSVGWLGLCPAPYRPIRPAASARYVVVVGWLAGLYEQVLQGPQHRQAGASAPGGCSTRRAPREDGVGATGSGAAVGERAGSCCSARPSGARPTRCSV